jgi:hypothetical protein
VSRPVLGRLRLACGVVVGVAAVPEPDVPDPDEPEDEPADVWGLGDSGSTLPPWFVCVLEPEEPDEPAPDDPDPDPESPNGSWYC